VSEVTKDVADVSRRDVAIAVEMLTELEWMTRGLRASRNAISPGAPTTDNPMTAPELDWSNAIAALTLLACDTLVLKSSKKEARI
jgi:hypothetical protein